MSNARSRGTSLGGVSVVIPTVGRPRALGVVLDRLAEAPVDEVIVVDGGSGDGTTAVVDAHRPAVTLVQLGRNRGVAARNLGASRAQGEFLLMLDDDSFPLPGAVETLLEAFRHQPRLGAAGGLVRDVDLRGRPVADERPGSFDWLLRAGRRGPAPAVGFPAFFFPAGACMIRRDALAAVGGFFEPFFHTVLELELATRLLGAGWDVRYLPDARFEHMKEHLGRMRFERSLRYRVRNHVWYFWLRFPPSLAARRIPGYLLFDLLECGYRRSLSAWTAGLADAWRERALVAPYRQPLPRTVLRRAELNRGRLHMRLAASMLERRLGHLVRLGVGARG